MIEVGPLAGHRFNQGAEERVRQSIESAAPRRRSRSLLGALLLAGFGYSLVQSLVVPALPTIQIRLRSSTGKIPIARLLKWTTP